MAAFAVRLLLVLRSPGGLTGLIGYDSGVYYAAGDALIHGRLPYRDFLLLHPPGLMLVLTPFAELGALTTDETGFVVANLVFMAVGAVNAALVVGVARRLGASHRGAVLGGGSYAVGLAAAAPEISARLEPLGNLLLLSALWCVAKPGGERETRRVVTAGVLLGLACAVKLWWCVPLVLVGGWLVVRTRRRETFFGFAAGAAGAFAVVVGPFLAMAPTDMVRMLVRAQLGRPYDLPVLDRLEDLLAVHVTGWSFASVLASTVIVVVCASLVLLGVLAWRRGVRLPVLLGAVQLGVILAVPHYSNFYSGFVTVAIALVVAAAAFRPALVALFVLVLAVETVVILVRGTGAAMSSRFPRTELAVAVADVRCVLSDSPMALIELDALSRGLAAGCPNWVDVSGRTYDADRASGPADEHRYFNTKWQADAARYLTSGDAVILVRPASGFTPETRQAVQSGELLARAGRYSVYRTPQ